MKEVIVLLLILSGTAFMASAAVAQQNTPLLSSPQEPATVEDLLNRSISAVNSRAWSQVQAVSQVSEITIRLNSQITSQLTERWDLDLTNSRWRIATERQEAKQTVTERLTIGRIGKSETYKFRDNRIVGSSVQSSSEPPALFDEPQLLKSSEQWQLEKFNWEGETFWSLVSSDGAHRRLYNLNSYELRVVIRPTDYGESVTEYSDYRDISGRQIPHTVVTRVPSSNYETRRVLLDIRIEPQFPANHFDFLVDWQKIITGKQIPDFQIPGLLDDEQVYSRESLQGKVVLIDFWATWCAPCVADFPELSVIESEFRDDSFVILAVSLDTEKESARQFALKNAERWQHGWMTDGFESPLAELFEIASIPRTILLGADGTILAIDEAARGSSLRKKLEELFHK